MLQTLRIQNFKGWSDTGVIKFAPLTLFFGPNSSGKSSIGQFLMMLKQTVESPDRKAVIFPGSHNTAVDLGGFSDIIYKRDSQNRLSFNYSWSLQKAFDFKDSEGKKSYSFDTIDFFATIRAKGKDNPAPLLENLKYILLKDQIRSCSIDLQKSPSGQKYDLRATDYKFVRTLGRAWPFRDPVRFYGFPDTVVGHHKNADFVQALNLYHEQLFHSLFYLGPLRSRAARLYPWTGIEPESVGYSGESTISAILAARERRLNFGPKQHTRIFGEVIAYQLQQLGLIENFKVQPISKQRQEYEVKVRVKKSDALVDLPDVGFGVSQVLPVLTQCFYAPANSIIIMEQPEIHLHPSAQSNLADVMIDVINSREHGVDRNTQLVIETHSEHFLRRLQRRIAEGAIQPDQVAAYFVDCSKGSSALIPLEIDLFGNIANWPPHFFGDDMGDMIAQSKAALKRQQGGAL